MADRLIPFEETLQKFPDVPRFIILKLDIQRRGVTYTDRLIDFVQPKHPGPLPPLMLRDGTTVLCLSAEMGLEHYVIDYVDGKISIFFDDTYIDEAELGPEPKFIYKETSRGTPMWCVAGAPRPQRLDILTSRFCQMWKGGHQCKFCFWNTMFDARGAGVFPELNMQDVTETVHMALQEKGRFSQVMITGGADPGGDIPYDAEVDQYIKVLQAVGENFSGRRFPSQIISSAFSRKQLKRIYEETGVLSYCPDIEVWDEEIFKWLCPGKEKYIGQKNWIRSMLDAVEIFGKGNVYTNFVAGCEMAQPHGFKTEEEALESNFEGCEYLAKNGISMMALVWNPIKGTGLHGQKQPSLDYYVRLAKGLHDIRATYGLHVHGDDYKHCSNHADSDLCRID